MNILNKYRFYNMIKKIDREKRLFENRQKYKQKIMNQIEEINESIRAFEKECSEMKTFRIQFSDIDFIREFDEDGYIYDYTKESRKMYEWPHNKKNILETKKKKLRVQFESLILLDNEYYKNYGV